MWVRSEVQETEALMDVIEAMEANGPDPFARAWVRALMPAGDLADGMRAYERLPMGAVHSSLKDPDEPHEMPDFSHAGARAAELKAQWVRSQEKAEAELLGIVEAKRRRAELKAQAHREHLEALRNKTLAPSAMRHLGFLAS